MENHLIALYANQIQITCIIIKACSKIYNTLLTLEKSNRIYLTPIINILRKKPSVQPGALSTRQFSVFTCTSGQNCDYITYI